MIPQFCSSSRRLVQRQLLQQFCEEDTLEEISAMPRKHQETVVEPLFLQEQMADFYVPQLGESPNGA